MANDSFELSDGFFAFIALPWYSFFMKEGLIRKAETENQTPICVETLYIVGQGTYQQRRQLESRRFAALDGAFNWIARDPQHSHRIIMPYEKAKKIKPRLVTINGEEVLEIEAEGKKRQSKPLVEEHHDVSTDHKNFFHIIVEGADEVIQNGAARIRFDNPTNPLLDFTFQPGNYTPEKLKRAFEFLDFRISRVLNDLRLGASRQFLPIPDPCRN